MKRETFKPYITKRLHINALQLTREMILEKTGKAETYGTQTIVTYHGGYAVIEKDGIQYTALPGDYIIRQFNDLTFCKKEIFQLLYEEPKKKKFKFRKAKKKWVMKNMNYVSVHDSYGSHFSISFSTGKISYNISSESDRLFISSIRYLTEQVDYYDVFYVILKLFRNFNRTKYTFIFDKKEEGNISFIEKILERDRLMDIARRKQSGY